MARTRFTVKEGLSVADDTTTGGYPLIPTGTVMAYAGSTAPDGWLLCNGAAVSRTTYANLWALVSSTYGGGNGTSTFNVPDMRSRMPIGAGSGTGLTSRTLAATGGAETVTIASGNLPTHQHTLSAHTHTSAAHVHGLNSHTHTSAAHDHTLSNHSHSLGDHSHTANHGHTASSANDTASHTHSLPRASIFNAGTNRLGLSASPTDNGLSTNGTSHVHAHGVTVDTNNFSTGGPSAGSGVPSTNATNSVTPGNTGVPVAPTTDTTSTTPGATGGPNSDTTGNGGFANTALAMMNPFLALNYIIKY
jgi:microcystin-dependent protein